GQVVVAGAPRADDRLAPAAAANARPPSGAISRARRAACAPAGKTLFSFVVNVSNAQYLRVPIWFRVAANR
ncbi:hypothetical protein, partial [Burkholderia multivorans]|uniref:hypothetical protein n=1 Tax=Burkholderia multivorans TaxID=87883 RepID=UPI001EE655C8